MYKSSEAKAYALACGSATVGLKLEPLEGPVSVKALVYFPSLRGDLDNRLKVLLDALEGIAYADDRQVYELYAIRMLDRENPRVEITVTQYWDTRPDKGTP